MASGNAHEFAKAVKFATGWERGKDGKWRYEMPDGEVRSASLAEDTEDVSREEQIVLNGEYGVRFSLVEDPGKIAELEQSPKRTGYRSVVLRENGRFSSPMAYWLQSTKDKAKSRVETAQFELSKWEQAEEHPELVDEKGKITLVKPSKSTVDGVAYDPYIHNRLEPVNLQFKDAWQRPDLVYVETEIPESDLQSGYHAEKALLPVGVHSWSNGDLILSRYDKPTRIMPWEEVADAWAERLQGKSVNFDVVSPQLLPLLEERGVDIIEPHKGMGKDCFAKYEQWKQQSPARFSLNEVNEQFNEDLERYENNDLEKGYRFELGYPSKYLLRAGFDNLPIYMRASLLSRKAGDENHPFVASDLKDLVKAIQKPIAIFKYSKPNMLNLIVDTSKNGKQFLVGVTLNYNANGIEINSISGLFPKENHEWIKWIQDGKTIRIDQKEKVQDLINSLRTNPAESERIGLNLDSVSKLVQDFENPKISEENLSENSSVRFSLPPTRVENAEGKGGEVYREAYAADLYESRMANGMVQFREAIKQMHLFYFNLKYFH